MTPNPSMSVSISSESSARGFANEAIILTASPAEGATGLRVMNRLD